MDMEGKGLLVNKCQHFFFIISVCLGLLSFIEFVSYTVIAEKNSGLQDMLLYVVGFIIFAVVTGIVFFILVSVTSLFFLRGNDETNNNKFKR